MSFVRQFAIYFVGGTATRIAAVVLVPLYTRTLAVADYGRLEVLLAIHALTLVLAGMQLESSIARDFYVAQERGELAQMSWVTLALTALGASIIAAAVLAIWKLGWLPGLYEAKSMALLVALTFPAQVFGVQLVILRFSNRAAWFATVSFLDLALSALFSVYFIIELHWGVAGALAGMLISKSVCVLGAWPATFGLLPKFGAIRPLASRLLGYGVPAVPAVLIGWIQNAGSRILLAVALTLRDVAIIGVAIKVAAIYSFVVFSFRMAWEPFSMARIDAMEADPKIYQRTLEWYVAAMLLVAGLSAIVGPLIVRILAPAAYAPAGPIAALFLLGQFWVGATNILVIGIHGSRRTWLLLPVYGLGALLNVVVLFSLVQVLGIVAAGLGFFAGSVASAFLARHFSNKYFNTVFSFKIVGWAALASAAFGGLWILMCGQLTSGPVLMASGAVGLALCFAIVMTRAFDPGSVSSMWSALAAFVRRRGFAP